MAEQRHAGNTHYLGSYCSRRAFFGICIRRSRAWCVFGSKLGRILQQQGRAQLGIGWWSCRGLTVAEIEGIDFASLDLSEFTEDLMDGARDPALSLPEASKAEEAMRMRVTVTSAPRRPISCARLSPNAMTISFMVWVMTMGCERREAGSISLPAPFGSSSSSPPPPPADAPPGGGWGNTNQGKVVAAAFMDATNKIIDAVRTYVR